MAKIIDVKDASEKLNLAWRQLPLSVDDDKVMILQLSDTCEYCKGNDKKDQSWSEETFLRKYTKLSREEILAATMVSSKTLFSRLAQVVGCVGCRRSCERLYNQLKEKSYPCMEPLTVGSNGVLSVFMKCSLQSKVLNNLFSTHKIPLPEMLESIPKYKKSGRCILHSMEGVRCRAGSQAWLEMWNGMSKGCKESVTSISCDMLLTTLDNYLRKHRFCHECKNKVHRAYNILVGNVSIDASKEKGFVASLYSGITRCEKTHIHVKAETDFMLHLITRAEPELQGRRERHAKTLEIAQEEVLTCVGLFLYEKLQRVYARMKDEEQAFDILFHVGLDAIRRNFEMAVEEKQGFSKFEKLCEELQKQELIVKAKKEKKNKKKRNKKKNEESKENTYICEEDDSCDDCETGRSPTNNVSKTLVQQLPLKPMLQDFVSSDENLSGDKEWDVVGKPLAKRKPFVEKERDHHSVRAFSDFTGSNNCASSPEVFLRKSTSSHHHYHSSPRNSSHHHSSPQHLDCAISIDSIASRCSQCSRDGGYCSAQCSSSSSRDSSDVACGEGFCSHSDDHDSTSIHNPVVDAGTTRGNGACSDRESDTFHWGMTKQCLPYAPSLQEMLEDSSCDTDEIPEAEVKAWYARLGAVKQKRAELRQTLLQRFQQLCHRKNLAPVNGQCPDDRSPRTTSLRCHNYVSNKGLTEIRH